MKRLYKAKSIIERDALMSRLLGANILAASPPRDMSRKVTDTTIDLALDGYSIMFDGFDILVPNEDQERSTAILIQFLTDVHTSESPPEAAGNAEAVSPNWDRFYFCSIFSLMFPFLPSVLATYFLIGAIGRREPWRRARWRLVGALVCYVVGASVPILFFWPRG